MNTTLLFDVDGTLIDSFPGIRHGFLLGLKDVGWDVPDEDFIRRIPGPPMPETMRSLGMSAAQVDQAMRAYSDYMSGEGWQRFEVYPGMDDLVERLAGEGYRVCTATSKSERFGSLTASRSPRTSWIHSYMVGPSRTGAPTVAPGSVKSVTAPASVFIHSVWVCAVTQMRPAPIWALSTMCRVSAGLVPRRYAAMRSVMEIPRGPAPMIAIDAATNSYLPLRPGDRGVAQVVAYVQL